MFGRGGGDGRLGGGRVIIFGSSFSRARTGGGSTFSRVRYYWQGIFKKESIRSIFAGEYIS